MANSKAKSKEIRKQGVKQMKNSIKNQYLDTLPQLADTAVGALNTVGDLARGNVIGAAANGIKTVVSGAKTVGKTIKHGFNGLKGLAKTMFNHPEWYEHYDLGGMINLNYGRRIGTQENTLSGSNNAEGTSYLSSSVCSICQLPVLLTKPQTNTKDWEQAIQYLYSTIRSANSGSVNYSMYDVERYVLDVRNIHAMYAYLRRAYATLNNVSLYDATSPRAYFYAMGLDYDDFVSNAADLKEWANKLSIQVSRLVPLNIDLINRTRWMFSNLFADSDDVKSSKYVFSLPYVVPYYELTTVTKPIAFSYYGNSMSSLTKYSAIYTTVNDYMNKVINNDTYAIIAGDILKAFGNDAIYPSEVWDESMPTPIVYDEAALTQIQNASIQGFLTTNNGTQTTTWEITDNNFVKQTIFTVFNGASYASETALQKLIQDDIYVNTYKDSMTPGETISATRLACRAKVTEGSSTVQYLLDVCGTEVVIGFGFVNITNGSYKLLNLSGFSTYFMNNIILGNYNQNDPTQFFITSAISTLDWFPRVIMYAAINNNVATARIPIATMWDFNNYAVTDPRNLSSLHGYAALSLLAVPRVARQNNVSLIVS